MVASNLYPRLKYHEYYPSVLSSSAASNLAKSLSGALGHLVEVVTACLSDLVRLQLGNHIRDIFVVGTDFTGTSCNI